MFQVSARAEARIRDYIHGKFEGLAVRLYRPSGRGEDSMLGMALDEEKEDDLVFKVNDLIFVIDKALLEETKTIRVDYVEGAANSGFVVKAHGKFSGPSGKNADDSRQPCC